MSDRQYNHGKRLIEALRISVGERVLDVGCGTGRLAAYVAGLVGPSGTVAAVDPLPLRVALARKKSGTNVEVSVAAAEDLSQFAAESFDVVFLNSVFHWLPDKLGPLRQIQRVLRRGGRLGISTAAREKPHDFELILREVFARPEFRDLPEKPSGTPYKVSAEELSTQLTATGFAEIEVPILSFTDHFAVADDVLAFNLASSFGNFLSHVNGALRVDAERLLRNELEKRRETQGIRLERHLVFAQAKRA